MKKFRKMIEIVCMMAMLVCLTACGSSGGSQETDGKPDTPETTVSQQEKTDESPDTGAAEPAGEQAAPVTEPADAEETGEGNSKVLVAYFSATGTTKTLAEYAADAMGQICTRSCLRNRIQRMI